MFSWGFAWWCLINSFTMIRIFQNWFHHLKPVGSTTWTIIPDTEARHDIPKNKQCRHEKTLRAKSEHTFAQAMAYNTTYTVCAFVIWSYVCSLAWHTFWADILSFWADIVKSLLPTQLLQNISSIYLLQLLIWLEAKIKAQEFLDYICKINQMLMLKHKEKDSFAICY